MTKVVSYTTTSFHQLHLFLVNLHDSAIRVGITIKPNNKAVTQRSHLIIIAYTRHRATSRNYILEMVKKFKYLLCRKRISVFLLYASNLVSNAPMHLFWTFLIDISKAVLHSILVNPYTCSKLVAIKIFKRCLESFFKAIYPLRFHCNLIS